MIFYDRNNAAALTIVGGASNLVAGTVYAKSAHYFMAGTSGALSHNGAVIVGELTTTGSSNFSISFDTDYAHPLLGRSAILVE